MKIPLQLGVESSAGIGGPHCEYRYFLTRSWNLDLGLVLWIMLNPSVADAESDDPTLVKVQTFTRLWGYGACEVVNLFAYRATSPVEMKRYRGDSVGVANFGYVERAARRAKLIVCAWGKDGAHLDRGNIMLANLWDLGLDLHALKLNNDGSPAHPLYLPYSTKPFKMEPHV